MEWNVWIAIGAMGLYLFYWWKRPIHWQDGEGPLEPHHSLFDSDIWSLRWWFINHTETGQLVGHGLNLRDWYENERRRWKR